MSNANLTSRYYKRQCTSCNEVFEASSFQLECDDCGKERLEELWHQHNYNAARLDE